MARVIQMEQQKRGSQIPQKDRKAAQATKAKCPDMSKKNGYKK